MAKRNASELIAGAVVLVVALGFLGYAVANTGRGVGAGYTLHARFDHIDGIAVGSDVRVAGVKVGAVSEARIDPQSFQAVVSFTMANAIQLPEDSSVVVTSDGLLGTKFLAVAPGGDTKTLADGGTVKITQSSVSLEDLLGKFIFSVGDLSSNVQKHLRQEDQAAGAQPPGAPANPGALAPLPK
jgi:phospholipid/cholesterol/gamma-HCH transport system substrate-binding protein